MSIFAYNEVLEKKALQISLSSKVQQKTANEFVLWTVSYLLGIDVSECPSLQNFVRILFFLRHV